MTDQAIILQSVQELFPAKDEQGGGHLVTSGVAFDHVSSLAAQNNLKTIGIVGAFLKGENLSTPIVVDVDPADGVYVLTQDSDHIVASREQLASLRTVIDGILASE